MQQQESLTLALSLSFSVVSSCCVHTAGRTVRVARRLCVETVIPWSVAMAATKWNYNTFIYFRYVYFYIENCYQELDKIPIHSIMRNMC